MTDPTSLEALAEKWERDADVAREYTDDVPYRNCAHELRAYIAARPASDLVNRFLRALADEFELCGRKADARILLEAADALAATEQILVGASDATVEDWAKMGARLNDLEGGCHVDSMRIAELERALAEANARADRAERHKQGFVDQAVQEQRARIAAEARVTWLEQRIATKDALIECLEAEQLAKVEELEAAEARLAAVAQVVNSPTQMSASLIRDRIRAALATTAQPSEEKPGRVIGQLAISSHGNPDYDEEPEPWGRP